MSKDKLSDFMEENKERFNDIRRAFSQVSNNIYVVDFKKDQERYNGLFKKELIESALARKDEVALKYLIKASQYFYLRSRRISTVIT